MRVFDSAEWTGKDAEKRPHLIDLINRYVPLVTREDVFAMAAVHEKQVSGLLNTVWDYEQRNKALNEHLHKLNLEYGEAHRIPVDMGVVGYSTDYDAMRQVTRHRVDWRPSPFQMGMVLADEPLRAADFPTLFKAVMADFDRMFDEKLKPQLRDAYAKLFQNAPRSRR